MGKHAVWAGLGMAALALVGCRYDLAPPPPAAAPGVCDGFIVPPRGEASACDDVDASDPARLVACLRGSGHAGRWAVDADGLPAYDFASEERCDPAAHAFSPRRTPLRDPIALV